MQEVEIIPFYKIQSHLSSLVSPILLRYTLVLYGLLPSL
jgi:hypothetical protein